MKTLFSGLLLLVTAALASADAWVVVHDKDSSSMHGDTRDLEAARSHFQELGPGYLWFRRGGKEYLVRDQGALQQIEDATRPQAELGQAQGELGRKQGDLGRQQGEIGRLQGELGRKQAKVAMRRAQRDLNGEKPSPEDRDDERDVAETQRQLGKAQGVLGREQGKLGEEQGKMGRKQAALSKDVEKKVEEVIETALKNGSAKPI